MGRKMKWKNLPTWLKGGIIGLIIGILISFGNYLYYLLFEQREIYLLWIKRPSIIRIVILFPFVIAAIISSLIGLRGRGSILLLPYRNLFIFLVGLVIYFLIGALIGSIVEKVGRRRKIIKTKG